jgi:error-prone DNA polymerase
MDPEERLVADFRGTGLTVGPHPMAYHRARMDAIGVHKASDLAGIPNGKYLRIDVSSRAMPGYRQRIRFSQPEDETEWPMPSSCPTCFRNRLLVTSNSS